MSDPVTSILTPESPWLGLRSFTEATRGYFFGRDAELADLYERVVHRALTVCYGQSGQGKTSLMNAGLVPRLRETGWLPVPIRITWGDDDPDVETQVRTELRKALGAVPLPRWRSLADFPQDVSLWELLHDPQYRLVYGSPEAAPWRLVFLFDQFEEIFTLGERHRDRTDAWRDTLGDMVENRLPASVRARLQRDTTLLDRFDLRAFHIRFVLTLRHDYLHALERWRRYIPSLLDNRFELKALNGKQAFQAVVYPGRLRSSDNPIVDEATGGAIVRFVASAPPERPLVEIEAVPPLLSLICAELNAERLALGGSHLYFDPFFGEPPALRQFIESIPSNADGVREPIARSVAERELVGRGLTPQDVQDSLNRLIDKGLLQPEGTGASERLHLSAELMKFAGRGGTDILQAFYTGCFTGLPGTVRLWVEDTLLSPEGFRQTLNYDTALAGLRNLLTSPGDAERALDQLITNRLLIAEEHGAVRRVELTHDILAPIVRESRDRRKQTEAKERAQAKPKTSRSPRVFISYSTSDTRRTFWDHLLSALRHGGLVPVVGWKAITLEPDETPLDTALAGMLADDLGLTVGGERPKSFDELMLAARRRDVNPSHVHRALRRALQQIEPSVKSGRTDALASMTTLGTYVVTSCDSTIEDNIRRHGREPLVHDVTSDTDDIWSSTSRDTTRVVYLASRLGTSYQVPLTTGEILELWLNLLERPASKLDWLRRWLEDKTLLFLGIDWSLSWSRLLPRVLRGPFAGFELASFIDTGQAESSNGVMLLDPEGNVEWMPLESPSFLAEMAQRVAADGASQLAASPVEPAPRREFTVFLSYAREDIHAAERIVRQLQDVGLDVWFDREQLVAGDSFIQATRKAIDDCSLFVSMISRATSRRSEALFHAERALAAERARRIDPGRPFYIPLVVDDTQPPFENEPFANLVQFARAPEGRLSPEDLRQFVDLARQARREGVR